MKKHLNDQYNMLLSVESLFDSDESIWASNVLISDAKTSLSDVIEQITTAAKLQKVVSTGMTMDKAAVRTDLETKGLFLSSALSAYASIHGDQNHMYRNVHITKTAFKRFRGADLLENIDNLREAAMEIIEALEVYGVTEATLTELAAARTAFHLILKSPIEIITDRKDATDAIPVLLRQAASLLEKTMDNLMKVFSSAEPHFVNIYFMARKIRKTGERTLSLEILTLDAGNNTPLEGVQIEVVDKGIKRISTKKGQNRVRNLKEGHYTLSVSHPDFAPQMIPFTVISGQTTKLVIEMAVAQKANETDLKAGQPHYSKYNYSPKTT